MTRGLGSAVLAVVLAFLYLPVLVLVVYSFNASRFAVSWQGFTLAWYAKLLDDPETARAAWNTLVVAGSSTVVATLLGSTLALGLRFQRVPGRRALEALLMMPVVFPDIVIGVALLAGFVFAGVPLGLRSIVLAHVSFQVSFVWLILRGALEEFPGDLLEAARDLGCSETGALARVALPLLWPAILAAALIAATLSVDDFVIAYFTAGPGSSTLSVRIYAMVKRGVTPDINALCALLLVASTLALAAARLLLQRGGFAGPDEALGGKA